MEVADGRSDMTSYPRTASGRESSAGRMEWQTGSNCSGRNFTTALTRRILDSRNRAQQVHKTLRAALLNHRSFETRTLGGPGEGRHQGVSGSRARTPSGSSPTIVLTFKDGTPCRARSVPGFICRGSRSCRSFSKVGPRGGEEVAHGRVRRPARERIKPIEGHLTEGSTRFEHRRSASHFFAKPDLVKSCS